MVATDRAPGMYGPSGPTGPAVHITSANYLVPGEDETAFEAEEASIGVESTGGEAGQ